VRCAQNSRSQFPQRYCLIKISLNSLSSKSRRRARLIKLLPQLGHVITRKCLYSLISRSEYLSCTFYVRRADSSNGIRVSIFGYRPLSRQNRRPHFVQLYGLIHRNLNSLSNTFRRWDRAIITLLHFGHRSGDKPSPVNGRTISTPLLILIYRDRFTLNTDLGVGGSNPSGRARNKYLSLLIGLSCRRRVQNLSIHDFI
jgi:hypothetical protein